VGSKIIVVEPADHSDTFAGQRCELGRERTFSGHHEFSRCHTGEVTGSGEGSQNEIESLGPIETPEGEQKWVAGR
jgi:hypothetical protein